MLKVSVIIINYNTPDLTRQSVSELIKNENHLDWQIIVIDNGSEKRVGDKDFPEEFIEVIKNEENLGFARAVNQGLEKAKGDYVLLLNSDLVIADKAVSKMLGYLRNNKEVGVIGPKINFPDGRWQISFGKFPSLWREFLRISRLFKIIPGSTITGQTFLKKVKTEEIQDVDWITGACFLSKRDTMRELGGMDGKYFLGGEDFDFCFRVRKKGFKVVYYPLSQAYHHHGASSGGTGSLFRLKMDRDGVDRFFQKNLAEKKISRSLVRFMYNLRISLARITFRGKFKSFFSEKYHPESATIAVTYNCNARCQMCNIWRQPQGRNLSLETLANLDGDLKYINLSGGEPFLNPELPEIIKFIKKNHPRANIIISSNGYAIEMIRKAMLQILSLDPKVGVRVSLDGSRENHDRIRGVDGMYDKATSCLEELEKIGVTDLGVGFTIMDENAQDLEYVYDLAQEKGWEFSLSLVQNSDIYFQKDGNKITLLPEIQEQLDKIIIKELKGRRPKKWLRAYFNHGLKHFATTGERLLPTGAGFDSLFVDVNGDVFPGNLINFKMGNLKQDSLSRIWDSAQSQELRERIRKGEAKEAWTICTLRGEMKKNWYRIIPWIAKNKIKSIKK